MFHTLLPLVSTRQAWQGVEPHRRVKWKSVDWHPSRQQHHGLSLLVMRDTDVTITQGLGLYPMIPLLDGSQQTPMPHIINPAWPFQVSIISWPAPTLYILILIISQMKSPFLPVDFVKLLCLSPSEKPTTAQSCEVNKWVLFARTT